MSEEYNGIPVQYVGEYSYCTNVSELYENDRQRMENYLAKKSAYDITA